MTDLTHYLTSAAGLSGPARWALAGPQPWVTVHSRQGEVTVTVAEHRVVAHWAGPEGSVDNLGIGHIGQDGRAIARRAVVAARAFGEPAKSRTGGGSLHDLVPLLRAQGPAKMGWRESQQVLIVEPTKDRRTAILFTHGSLVLGHVDDALEMFGAFGAETSWDIAQEVRERLDVGTLDRARGAAAWDGYGAQLHEELQTLTVTAQADSRGLPPQAAQAQLELLGTAREALRRLEQERTLTSATEAGALVARTGDELRTLRGRPPRPAPRLIRDWSQAEDVVTEWVEWMGLGRAARTGGTGDGGIDVESATAVAQVKDYGSPLTAGPVREIFANGQLTGKQPLIFARAGFTADALAWGEKAGVAMFTFDLQGVPSPVSPAAHQLTRGG